MSDFTSGLIPCSICSNSIGTQAETCPQCGSPNNWKHPRLLELEKSRSSPTRKSINFKIKGAEISAENSYHSWIFILVYVVLALPAVFIAAAQWGFFGAAITGAILGLVWATTTKKRFFNGNVITGTWRSSDDKFWLPLVHELEIGIPESQIKSGAEK